MAKFKHIMVVDDQAADQLLAKYAISEYNPDAIIYPAYDGVEALALLDTMEAPPDIIFLDINMPRMNGFEFLETYTEMSKKAPVLVMLTSSDQESDRSQCESYNVVAGYETKPISVEILQRFQDSLSA